MIFSSSIFLFVFLPTVVLVYYAIPSRRTDIKNIVLLFASLCFFGWSSPKHILLLLASIMLNFLVGFFIDKFSKRRKPILATGIVLNLSLLFFYKYLGFTIESANYILGTSLTIPNIVLPIGISFFTFQGMSYIMDVYRGTSRASDSIINFALYMALFPPLIAGPIVKYNDINSQLNNHPSSVSLFSSGVEQFIIGLSKKMLIADVLGAQSATIYATLASGYGVDTPSAWLAAVCYMMQIYFDFSGYSDMALGLAKMFGFNLLKNFNYPYISASITEFWRRWHISLSTWFRDYLYIPLGGNRRGNVYFNLFIVFCATGIWHGASWQFLLWGLWHGMFLIIEKIMIKHNLLYKIPSIVRWVSTMFIVLIGWVMFGAKGFDHAMQIYQALFGLIAYSAIDYSFSYYFNNKVVVTLILAIIGATPLIARLLEAANEKAVFTAIKRVGLLSLLLLCAATAASGTYSPFIYFRF